MILMLIHVWNLIQPWHLSDQTNKDNPKAEASAISFRFFFSNFVIRVKDFAPAGRGLASAFGVLDTHDFKVFKKNRKENLTCNR